MNTPITTTSPAPDMQSAPDHQYYIRKADQGFELRQTRFEHLRNDHPHDVCAVWMTWDQWDSMKHHFTGSIRPFGRD